MRGLAGTVLWSIAAAGIGIGLFFIKHEVKEQEARLSELNREIQRNQEAIHVLRAEWSFLNDPTRLRALSERHLGMKPMAPAQVATLDTIPRDVPAGPVLAVAPKAVAAPKVAAAAIPPKESAPKAVVAVAPVKPAAAPAPAKSDALVRAAPPPLPPIYSLAAKPAQAPAPATATAGRVIIIQSPSLAASEAVRDGGAR